MWNLEACPCFSVAKTRRNLSRIPRIQTEVNPGGGGGPPGQGRAELAKDEGPAAGMCRRPFSFTGEGEASVPGRGAVLDLAGEHLIDQGRVAQHQGHAEQGARTTGCPDQPLQPIHSPAPAPSPPLSRCSDTSHTLAASPAQPQIGAPPGPGRAASGANFCRCPCVLRAGYSGRSARVAGSTGRSCKEVWPAVEASRRGDGGAWWTVSEEGA